MHHNAEFQQVHFLKRRSNTKSNHISGSGCHGAFTSLAGWTFPPYVYYSVQLPWQQLAWQPAPLPLSGEQRDHREHPALLRSSCFLLQTVLNPFFPSFSSVTSEVQSAGYYLSGKQLSCHFLKLWVCNNSVCSGKRGQVWDRSWC